MQCGRLASMIVRRHRRGKNDLVRFCAGSNSEKNERCTHHRHQEPRSLFHFDSPSILHLISGWPELAARASQPVSNNRQSAAIKLPCSAHVKSFQPVPVGCSVRGSASRPLPFTSEADDSPSMTNNVRCLTLPSRRMHSQRESADGISSYDFLLAIASIPTATSVIAHARRLWDLLAVGPETAFVIPFCIDHRIPRVL